MNIKAFFKDNFSQELDLKYFIVGKYNYNKTKII